MTGILRVTAQPNRNIPAMISDQNARARIERFFAIGFRSIRPYGSIGWRCDRRVFREAMFGDGVVCPTAPQTAVWSHPRALESTSEPPRAAVWHPIPNTEFDHHEHNIFYIARDRDRGRREYRFCRRECRFLPVRIEQPASRMRSGSGSLPTTVTATPAPTGDEAPTAPGPAADRDSRRQVAGARRGVCRVWPCGAGRGGDASDAGPSRRSERVFRCPSRPRATSQRRGCANGVATAI